MKYNKNGFWVTFLKRNLSSKQTAPLKSIRDAYRSCFDQYPYRKCILKNKVIFIHIPRTAGTSILESIGGWARDHCTYREFLQASPSRFERFFKFCFVRNPYDRLVSTYEYLKQGGNQDSDLVLQHRLLKEFDTFEKFVKLFLGKDMIYRVNLLKPQYWFIYDEHNNLKVDYVARFESIDSEFEKIRKILQSKNNTALRVTNASSKRRKDHHDYYDDSLKKIVQDLYALDFELLDYSK